MRSAYAFFFLIFVVGVRADGNGFIPALEEKIENKFTEYVDSFSKWLESFNDQHLGKTQLGRMIHYEEIKPKVEETGNQGRSVKKMSMAMMPLIFHVGATSTWMILTAIMTAKSLMVGLALLVFKIAVSSAKLASFFTLLKSKHGGHHHEWSPPAWTPHYEHHDHHLDHHPEHHGMKPIPFSPEWHNEIPHSYNEYKNHEFHDFKNTDFHEFKPHDFNDYKTIPTDIHNYEHFNTGFSGDFNHFEGAKKKIDSKVG